MRHQVLVQRQPVDAQVLAAEVRDEAEQLGVPFTVEPVDDVRAAYLDSAVVVTTPETPDLADLPHPAVRVDVCAREPDRSANVVTHIQGRGLDGVRWAMRTVVHHDSRESRRIAYGEHPEQYGELWLPEASQPTPPVAVLLHGGFWRSAWQLDLMDALAVDLARRGVAAWNVEYRRPDRHGWAATVADVEAAVRHVAELPGVDPTRVGVVGHSAGGQLAVRVAADLAAAPVSPSVVVSLAGVVDLVETQRRGIGEGATADALGGTYEELPETYERASPLLRLPTGARQIVVVAEQDHVDLVEMNMRYGAAAAESGDRTNLRTGHGNHFTLIQPHSGLWTDTAEELTMILVVGDRS